MIGGVGITLGVLGAICENPSGTNAGMVGFVVAKLGIVGFGTVGVIVGVIGGLVVGLTGFVFIGVVGFTIVGLVGGGPETEFAENFGRSCHRSSEGNSSFAAEDPISAERVRLDLARITSHPIFGSHHHLSFAHAASHAACHSINSSHVSSSPVPALS